MPSQRSAIRTELKDLITHVLNELTLDYSVYNNRIQDLGKTKLPIINIITPSEKIERQAESLLHIYELNLSIQIIDANSNAETLADRLDSISNLLFSIVLVFCNNPKNQKDFDLFPDDVSFSYQDELNKNYGSCIMNFIIRYQDDDALNESTIGLLDFYNTKDPETGAVIGFDLTKLKDLKKLVFSIKQGEDNPEINSEIIYSI